MGKTHSASGVAVWLAGCVAAPLVGVHAHPVPVLVGAAVSAGAALLPDIDHPSSLVSRSLGLPTRLLAHGVATFNVWLHAATKTERDRPDFDGHRCSTHTLVAAVLAGTLVAVGLALVGRADPAMAGWWWLGLPVGVGCLTHCLGDALTISGCPILWPLTIAGRRWYPIGPPKVLRFGTNGPIERWLVMPLLLVAAAGSAWALLSGPA